MKRLSIFADLTITIDDDTTIRVEGTDGQSLVVQLPSLRVAYRLWRRNRQTLFPLLQRVASTLPVDDFDDVTVLFMIDDVLVARMGAGVRSGIVAKAAGIDPVSISTWGALEALFSRRNRN